jgi:uncharacterized protein YodC (DUF2158 family)
MMFLKKIVDKILGPASKFKVGDSVQLKCGGHLMVVIEVCSAQGMQHPLIHCSWYESHPQQTRCNLFPEDHLMFFDWNQSHQNNKKKVNPLSVVTQSKT